MFNIYTANTSRYFNTEFHSYYQITVEDLLDQFLIFSMHAMTLISVVTYRNENINELRI